MNVLKYKGYLKIPLHNLGFFGCGRHGRSMKINGHYTVYLNIRTSKFCVWKHGDYASLTAIKKLAIKFLKINEAERKFLNDVLYSYSYRMISPTNITSEFWNKIYKEDKKEVEKAKSLPKSFFFKFEKKFISPTIRFGDKVKDIENNKVFTMDDSHDIRYINQEESLYKLIEHPIYNYGE